jgi:hypothetical protein
MPYNPGISNRSGELFAAGLARGLDSLSRGLEARQANIERLREEDKLAAKETKRMRGIAKSLQKDLGLTDSQIENSTSDELSGVVEGHFSKRKLDRHKAQMEAMAGNLELTRKNLGEAQYREDQRAQMASFNERLGAMPGYPDPATAAKMMAMEGLDVSSQTTMMQGLSALSRSQDQLGGSSEPVVAEKEGIKTVYSPRTGQFNVVQPEIDMTAKPIPGAPGYLQIGHQVVKKIDSSGMDPMVVAAKQLQLGDLQSQVEQLQAFKAKGIKSAKVDNEGTVLPGAVLQMGDKDIDTLLTQREAKIKALRKELSLDEPREFKKGDTAFQNGLKYVYDGKEWVATGPNAR